MNDKLLMVRVEMNYAKCKKRGEKKLELIGVLIGLLLFYVSSFFSSSSSSVLPLLHFTSNSRHKNEWGQKKEGR